MINAFTFEFYWSFFVCFCHIFQLRKEFLSFSYGKMIFFFFQYLLIYYLARLTSFNLYKRKKTMIQSTYWLEYKYVVWYIIPSVLFIFFRIWIFLLLVLFFKNFRFWNLHTNESTKIDLFLLCFSNSYYWHLPTSWRCSSSQVLLVNFFDPGDICYFLRAKISIHVYDQSTNSIATVWLREILERKSKQEFCFCRGVIVSTFYLCSMIHRWESDNYSTAIVTLRP